MWRLSRGARTRVALLVAAAALGTGTARATEPREQASALDRISGVTVTPSTLGALAVTIRSRPARAGSAGGGHYAVYRLTYRNRGRRTFKFVNNRSAQLFGVDRGLGLADDGCGFGGEPDEPVDWNCQYYLETIKLRPGETETRTITAWVGLQGMGELEAGDFTLAREVELERRKAAVREGTLDFTFSVTDEEGAGAEPANPN